MAARSKLPSVAALCLVPQAFHTLCVGAVCRIDKVARVIYSHMCTCPKLPTSLYAGHMSDMMIVFGRMPSCMTYS